MTEAEQVYKKDIVDKQRLNKSAMCKKNGPNTSKLGNRRLTNEEINERHGEVKMYKLDCFLSYSVFREMPNDLKVEYINKLCDKYDISIKHISRELFGQEDDALQKYLSINGILKLCNPDKKRLKTGLQQFKTDIYNNRLTWEPEKKPVVSPTNAKDVKFIIFQEFRDYTLDQKVDYINGLIMKYKVGYGAIGRYLFGKSDSWLSAFIKSNNLGNKVLNVTKMTSVADRPKHVKEFKAAIDAWKKESTKELLEEIAAIDAWRKKSTKELVEEIKEELPIETIEATEKEDLGHDIIKNLALNKDKLPDMAQQYLKPAWKEKEEVIDHHDTSFTSSYTRNGLDEEELEALKLLFKNKRVMVDIRVTVL